MESVGLLRITEEKSYLPHGERLRAWSNLAPQKCRTFHRKWSYLESKIADLYEAARAVLRRETFARLSAEHAAVDTTRHPGMHRTRSIDYVVVLAGKVRMLLDEG